MPQFAKQSDQQIYLKNYLLSLYSENQSNRILRRRLKGRIDQLGQRRLAGLQSVNAKTRRSERRHVHLARMFLKGKPLLAAESKTYNRPDWDRIEELILPHYSKKNYSYARQRFSEWLETINLQEKPKIIKAPRTPKKSYRLPTGTAYMDWEGVTTVLLTALVEARMPSSAAAQAFMEQFRSKHEMFPFNAILLGRVRQVVGELKTFSKET